MNEKAAFVVARDDLRRCDFINSKIRRLVLEKEFGATRVADEDFDPPAWHWPSR